MKFSYIIHISETKTSKKKIKQSTRLFCELLPFEKVYVTPSCTISRISRYKSHKSQPDSIDKAERFYCDPFRINVLFSFDSPKKKTCDLMSTFYMLYNIANVFTIFRKQKTISNYLICHFHFF